ncbi:hypothetical protein [Lichenifustis flavocetrariae]
MTLFAALDMVERAVGACRQAIAIRSLSFLKAVEKTVLAARAMHVNRDNHAAHKHPSVIAWLALHPCITFHFTLTSASRLNAVEGFFAILTKRRPRPGSYLGVVELQAAFHASFSAANGRSCKRHRPTLGRVF